MRHGIHQAVPPFFSLLILRGLPEKCVLPCKSLPVLLPGKKQCILGLPKSGLICCPEKTLLKEIMAPDVLSLFSLVSLLPGCPGSVQTCPHVCTCTVCTNICISIVQVCGWCLNGTGSQAVVFVPSVTLLLWTSWALQRAPHFCCPPHHVALRGAWNSGFSSWGGPKALCSWLCVVSGNGVLSLSCEKSISRNPHNRRFRGCGKIYWDRNGSLPSGSQYLIAVHPTVEKSTFVFIKPRTKAKVKKFCAIGSVHIKA